MAGHQLNVTLMLRRAVPLRSYWNRTESMAFHIMATKSLVTANGPHKSTDRIQYEKTFSTIKCPVVARFFWPVRRFIRRLTGLSGIISIAIYIQPT